MSLWQRLQILTQCSVQRFLDLDVVTEEERVKAFEGTNPHERVMKLDGEGRAIAAEKSDVVGVLQVVGGLH